MKKIICVLLAVLLLTVTALAETYADPEKDLSFTYDADAFAIGMDDVGDDEHLILLGGTQEAWGEYYIRIHLRELEDGETFPTLEDFADIEEALNTTATQVEWNGFKDAITYSIEDEESYESVCIIPVYDADDGEVEDILTLNIYVANLEDHEAAMARDDAISAVLDSLELLDD